MLISLSRRRCKSLMKFFLGWCYSCVLYVSLLAGLYFCWSFYEVGLRKIDFVDIVAIIVLIVIESIGVFMLKGAKSLKVLF